MCISFGISILFTCLVLILNERLSDIYFSLGTLSMYMFTVQGLYHTEDLTGGVFWLSGMKTFIINYEISDITQYFWLIIVITLAVVGWFLYLQSTTFYKILQSWWESTHVLQSFGIRTWIYKFGIIMITTGLAVVWGSVYAFYYRYISPQGFWLSFVTPLLAILILTTKASIIRTVFISIWVIGSYEALRFVKIVDPSKLGYVREMLFGLGIFLAAWIVFTRLKTARSI